MSVTTFRRIVKPPDIATALLVLYGVALVAFSPTLYLLVVDWLASPEYGHGLLVSGIAGYLVWRRRHLPSHLPLRSDPLALIYLAVAVLFYLLAMLGDVKVVKYYAFICALMAIACGLGGWRLVRALGFPILLLFFAIPLHPFLTNHLTADLQLVSSTIGVWFIHLMGIPALQEGNVINMGHFSLLVEEACSGLRYMLPLASLSLIVGYYYRGNKFTRVCIFLAAIPITVLMNSLRIAVTGFLIKYVGESSADGFLHDFEGWFVFLVSCGILALLLVILAKAGGRALTINENFVLSDAYAPGAFDSRVSPWMYRSMMGGVLLGGAVVNLLWLSKPEVIPSRQPFDQFPLALSGRDLYPDVLDSRVLDILHLDDYFIGDYLGDTQLPVNLYMAYYKSQQEGSLIHSPADCIPAGGWEIQSSEVIDLTSLGFTGQGNRAVIAKNGMRLLVYYWVNQQSLNYAREMDVFAALIWRSIRYGRTDATLVRVYLPLDASVDSEGQLREFIADLSTRVTPFLPH